MFKLKFKTQLTGDREIESGWYGDGGVGSEMKQGLVW